jgi:acyl carrier protein
MPSNEYDGLVAGVLEEIRAVLETDELPDDPSLSLVDVAGFDSIVIVRLLDRLERRYGVEVPPSLIVLETFATPGSLADVLARSGAGVNG